MGKIGSTTLRDWNTGDVMDASDYEKEREIFRTANNDNHDRVVDLESKTTKLAVDGSDFTGTWEGYTPKEIAEGINSQRIDSLDEQIPKVNPKLDVPFLNKELITITLTGYSLRENSVVYYPPQDKYYMLADAVPNNSVHYPNTYDTEIHLFSSTDLASWTYIGVAIPKGAAGELGDYGVATPAGAAYFNNKIYCPFSARNESDFTGRSIGLAWSGSDPSVIPWTKAATAISDTTGEDDDPALLAVDDTLHLYHRTTENDYHTVHSYSIEPETVSSWSTPNDAIVRDGYFDGHELTNAFFYKGIYHLLVSEQSADFTGVRIGHYVSMNPGDVFEPINIEDRWIDYFPRGANASNDYTLYSGGHTTFTLVNDEIKGFFVTANSSGGYYTIKGYKQGKYEGGATLGLFKAYSPGQTIVSGTATKVNFNVIDDPDGWFSSSSFTPKREGYYFFTCRIELQSMVDQKRGIIELRKNGTRVAGLDIKHASGTAPLTLTGGSAEYANGDTDYFEIYIVQENGVDTNIVSSDTWSVFQGHYLGF